MKRTPIEVPPDAKDRLKNYGADGKSYADILTRLMDEADQARFVSEMRRLANEGDYSPLESA